MEEVKNEELETRKDEKEETEAVNETAKEEVPKNQAEETQENETKEEPQASKAESIESLANRKFAEGAKKKEKEILSLCGVASLDELQALVTQARDMGSNYEALVGKAVCSDLNIKKDYQDVVVSMLKGKGLPMTEENAKSIIEKHPEWVDIDGNGSSIIQVGNVDGKGNPQDRTMFDKIDSWFK